MIKKTYLFSYTLLISVILTSCSSNSSSNILTPAVALETPTVNIKENTELNWRDSIKNISKSELTKNQKFNKVLELVDTYEINQTELIEFEQNIVNEFKSGKYLSDLDNDEYMLINIFKASVIEHNYDDKEQKLIDEFAFDFFQNVKYTYRGYETIDSDSVKSNELQMNDVLLKMK